MLKIRILCYLLAIFALALPATAADEPHKLVMSVHPHAPAVDDHSPTVNHPCHMEAGGHHGSRHAYHRTALHAEGGRDHIAIGDMACFAVQHFAAYHERPETFGRAEQWSREWELRWLDYEVSDRVVRVYHITSKRDPARRYLSLPDRGHGHDAEWLSIH